MNQTTKRRHSVLLAGGAIMTLLWLIVGAGCGKPTETPPDRVRRLAVAVKAGSPGTNPPVLTDGNWKDLYAGDSVWTDKSGEAELQLDGCGGSVWVFDNSALSVWTCTKQAQTNNEFWCAEDGTAAFNVDCTNRFEVLDTPSARVSIKGTAFTVTYLPERQLTLIVVLRGVVVVTPLIDLRRLELAEPVAVEAGNFIYTMPGKESPEVGGVPAREARPLNELPFVVNELDIRPWFDDIGRWAETQQVLPNSWPFIGFTLDFDGEPLGDSRVQEAFVLAIEKEPVSTRAFSIDGFGFTAIIGGEPVDAYTIPYDPERALAMLKEVAYDRERVVMVLFPEEDGEVAMAAKLIAGELSKIDIKIELVPMPGADLNAIREEYVSAGEPVLVVYR